MGIATIYKCDKCGNEQSTPEQFWKLGLTARCMSLGGSHATNDINCMYVCRPCLEALGIYVRQPKADAPPPPTLEDIIREIVRNTINDG